MLPAPYRLRKDQDIKRVFEKGRSVYDDVCGIKYVRNGTSTSRFAVIVGTKISKKAVDRNRLKRRIRAILAKKVSSIVPGFDVLLLPRPLAKDADMNTLETRLTRVFNKAKLCDT